MSNKGNYYAVWLVCTVNVRSVHFSLRITEPKSLPQNCFAYKLTFQVNADDWRNRVKVLSLPTISSPSLAEMQQTHGSLVEKNDAGKVLERMTE